MLICLILALRVRLHIVYSDKLYVYLGILFVKIKLFPSENKKKKPKKQSKKKEEYKMPILKDIKDAQPTSDSLVDKINSVGEIISIFFKAFKKQLNVKLAKIHITIATDDAAKTAIMYGAVSGAVACIIDLIDEITNLKELKKSSISIEPDFVSDKSNIDLNIVLSISIFTALKVALKSFINYIILKNKKQILNSKGKL